MTRPETSENTMSAPYRSYSWYVNLSDTFDNLPAILQEKGFQHEQVTLMISKLNSLPIQGSFDAVQRVLEEHEVNAWMRVFATAFESSSAFIESYRNHLHRNVRNPNYGEYYGIYQDDIMVTIGTYFPYKDFAFIANIATLPEYRGKGLATLMTKAFMQRSQDLGLKYVLLTASEDVQKFYEKFDFGPLTISCPL